MIAPIGTGKDAVIVYQAGTEVGIMELSKGFIREDKNGDRYRNTNFFYNINVTMDYANFYGHNFADCAKADKHNDPDDPEDFIMGTAEEIIGPC